MKKYTVLILLIPFIFSCSLGENKVSENFDATIEAIKAAL